MVIYEIVNQEDIPEDLPPGDYTTKVIDTEFRKAELLIRLEYIGEEYNSRNPQCLIPLTKHAHES